jgi:hypothetical protein
MARVLLLIILVWILYIVIKRAITAINDKDVELNQQKVAEKIVQCAICGTHVPESESLIKDRSVICNNPDCVKNS